jgi:hypothetical protein
MAGLDLNIDMNTLGEGIVLDEKTLNEIGGGMNPEEKEEVVEKETEVEETEETEETEEVEETEDTETDEGEKGEKSVKEKNDNAEVEQEYESPITLFAATLQDEGVLSGLDLEELDKMDDEQKIQTLIQKRNEDIETGVNTGIDIFIDGLPDAVKKIVNGYRDDLPLEELIRTQSEIQRWDNIKEEDVEDDENVQRQIHKAYYKEMTKFSDKEIEKKVSAEISDVDSADVALTRLSTLKEKALDKQKEIEES